MPKKSKSLPPGRNPPIFVDIGEQLDKPRVRKKGGPTGLTERLIVLWGMYQGWSNVETAHYANIGPVTAKRLRNKYFDNFLSVFNCPVIAKVGPNEFQCRFCSEIRSRRSYAQRHFMSHLFALEIAENIDLDDAPVAL